MAKESVTLSMEDLHRIQDRLLVGLASFAELNRIRENIGDGMESSLRDANVYPILPAAGDDEVGEFATALHILHIAAKP